MSEITHNHKFVNNCLLYSHSYGLFRKREQISWVLDNLWKPINSVSSFDPDSEEVQILKVSSNPLNNKLYEVLDEKSINEHELRSKYEDEGEVEKDLLFGPMSTIRVLYKKYCINIAIDISASMGALDLESGDVLFDRVMPCIRRILNLVTQPVDVSNGFQYYPAIYLTLCAVGGVYQPVQVLYKNLIIEKENLSRQLNRIEKMLKLVELNESDLFRLLQQKHKSKNLPNWANSKLSSVINNACIPFDFLPKDGYPVLFFLTDIVFDMNEVTSDSNLRVSSLGINFILVNVSNRYSDERNDFGKVSLGSTQMYCHVANTDLTRFFGKATRGTLFSYTFLTSLDDIEKKGSAAVFHSHQTNDRRRTEKVVQLLQRTVFYAKTFFRCQNDVRVKLLRDSYNYVYVTEFEKASKIFEDSYNKLWKSESYYLPADILMTLLEMRDREGFRVIQIVPHPEKAQSIQSIHLRYHFWPNIELEYLIEMEGEKKLKITVLVRSSYFLTQHFSQVAATFLEGRKKKNRNRRKSSVVGLQGKGTPKKKKKSKGSPTSLPAERRMKEMNRSGVGFVPPVIIDREGIQKGSNGQDEYLLLGYTVDLARTQDVMKLCVVLVKFVERIEIEDKMARKIYLFLARGEKLKKKSSKSSSLSSNVVDLTKEYRKPKQRVSTFYTEIQLSFFGVNDEDFHAFDVKKYYLQDLMIEKYRQYPLIQRQRDKYDYGSDSDDENMEFHKDDEEIDDEVRRRIREEEPPTDDVLAFHLIKGLEGSTGRVYCVPHERLMRKVLEKRTRAVMTQLLKFWGGKEIKPSESSSSRNNNRSSPSSGGLGGPKSYSSEPELYFKKVLSGSNGLIVGKIFWVTKIVMLVNLRFFRVSSKRMEEEAMSLKKLLEETNTNSMRWIPPAITNILSHLPKTTLNRKNYTKQRFFGNSFLSSFFQHKKWIWMLKKYSIVVNRILDVIFLERMREGFELVSFEISKVFMKVIHLKPEKDDEHTIPFHLFYCVHFLVQSTEVLTEYWLEPLFGTVSDGRIREGRVREIISESLYGTDRDIVSSFLTFQYILRLCLERKKRAAEKIVLMGEFSHVSSKSVSRRDFVHIPLEVKMLWTHGAKRSIKIPIYKPRKKRLFQRLMDYLSLLNDLEIDYWGKNDKKDRRKDCRVYICTINPDDYKNTPKDVNEEKEEEEEHKADLEKIKVVITMLYRVSGGNLKLEVCECSLEHLERGDFERKSEYSKEIFGSKKEGEEQLEVQEEEEEEEGESENSGEEDSSKKKKKKKRRKSSTQFLSKEVSNYLSFIEKLYRNSYAYEIYRVIHTQQEIRFNELKMTIESCCEYEEYVDMTEIFRAVAKREKLGDKSHYHFPFCYTKDTPYHSEDMSSQVFDKILNKCQCRKVEESKFHYFYRELQHSKLLRSGSMRRINSSKDVEKFEIYTPSSMGMNEEFQFGRGPSPIIRGPSPSPNLASQLGGGGGLGMLLPPGSVGYNPGVPSSVGGLELMQGRRISTDNFEFMFKDEDETSEPTNKDWSFCQVFVRFEVVITFGVDEETGAPLKEEIRRPVTYVSFKEISELIGELDQPGYSVRLRVIFISKPPDLNVDIYETGQTTKKMMLELSRQKCRCYDESKSFFSRNWYKGHKKRSLSSSRLEDQEREDKINSKPCELCRMSQYACSFGKGLIHRIKSLVSRDVLYLLLSTHIDDSPQLVMQLKRHLTTWRIRRGLLWFDDVPFRVLDDELGRQYYPLELQNSPSFYFNKVQENVHVVHLKEYDVPRFAEHSGERSAVSPLTDNLYYLYEEKEKTASANKMIHDDIFSLEENNEERPYPRERGKSTDGKDETFSIVKPYWIILETDPVDRKVCHITFFTPFAISKSRYYYFKELLREEVVQIIKNVNTRILLADLHDCRICSDLLLPPNKDEKKLKKMEKSRFDEMEEFKNKDFRLEHSMETMAFFLTSRVSAKAIINDLVRGYFNLLQIHNRLNMFVYRQDDSVYYFKLTNTSTLPKDTSVEVQTKDDREVSLDEIEDRSSQCLSPLGQFLLRKARSLVTYQVSQKRKRKRIGIGGDPTQTGTPAHIIGGRVNSPPPEEGDQQYIVLRFYGVDKMPDTMKDRLNGLITNLIRSKSVTLLSQLLERNRRFRLTFADLIFIRPFHSRPHKIGCIRLPLHDVIKKENLIRLMMMIRMNSRGFLHDLLIHDVDPEDGDQGFLSTNRLSIVQLFCKAVGLYDLIDDEIREDLNRKIVKDSSRTENDMIKRSRSMEDIEEDEQDIQGTMVRCQLLVSEGPTYGTFISQFVVYLEMVLRFLEKRKFDPTYIMGPKIFSFVGDLRKVFLQFQTLFSSEKPGWKDSRIPEDQRGIMVDLTIFVVKLINCPKTCLAIMYLKEALQSRIQEIADSHLNLKMSLCKAVSLLCRLLGKYCQIAKEETNMLRGVIEKEKKRRSDEWNNEEEKGKDSNLRELESEMLDKLDSSPTSKLGKKNVESSKEYFLEALEIERNEIDRLRKIRNQKLLEQKSSQSQSHFSPKPSPSKEQQQEETSPTPSSPPNSPPRLVLEEHQKNEQFEQWKRNIKENEGMTNYPFFPLTYSFLYNYHAVTNPASYSVGKGLGFVHMTPVLSQQNTKRIMKVVPSTPRIYPHLPDFGASLECQRVDKEYVVEEDGSSNISGFYRGGKSDSESQEEEEEEEGRRENVDFFIEIWRKGDDINVEAFMTMMEKCVNGSICELVLEQYLYDLKLKPIKSYREIWNRLLKPVKKIAEKVSKFHSVCMKVTKFTQFEKRTSGGDYMFNRRKKSSSSSTSRNYKSKPPTHITRRMNSPFLARHRHRGGRGGRGREGPAQRRKKKSLEILTGFSPSSSPSESPVTSPDASTPQEGEGKTTPKLAEEKEVKPEPLFIPYWHIRKVSRGILGYLGRLFGRTLQFREYLVSINEETGEEEVLDPSKNNEVPLLSKCSFFLVGEEVCKNIVSFGRFSIQLRLRQEFPFQEMMRHCLLIVEIGQTEVNIISYNIRYRKYVKVLEKYVRRVLEDTRYQQKCLGSLLVQKLGFFFPQKEELSLRKIHSLVLARARQKKQKQKQKQQRLQNKRRSQQIQKPHHQQHRERKKMKVRREEEIMRQEEEIYHHPKSLTDQYTKYPTETKSEKLKRFHEELYRETEFHTILESNRFLVTPMEEIDPDYFDPKYVKRLTLVSLKNNHSLLRNPKLYSPLEYNIRKTIESLLAKKFKTENEQGVRRICELMKLESSAFSNKAKLTHKEMEDTVRHSRLVHICRFPLFFSPLRYVIFDPGQFKSILRRVIPSHLLRKKLSSSEVREKSCYEEILEKFLFEYLNYMNRDIDVDCGSEIIHIVGNHKRVTSAALMPLIELSDSRKVVNCLNLCVYFLKVIFGGLFIVKVSFQSVWSCVNIYTFEDPLNPIPRNKRSKFLRMLNHIRDELHLNSFVYDFHLRRVKEFLEMSYHSIPRIKIASMMSDFSRYYSKENKAKFKKNELFQASFLIKVQGLLEGYDSIEQIGDFVREKVKSFSKGLFTNINDVVSVEPKKIVKWLKSKDSSSSASSGSEDLEILEKQFCGFFCMEKVGKKSSRRKGSVKSKTSSESSNKKMVFKNRRNSQRKKREPPKIFGGGNNLLNPIVNLEDEEEEEEVRAEKYNEDSNVNRDIFSAKSRHLSAKKKKKQRMYRETRVVRMQLRLYLICTKEEDEDEDLNDEDEEQEHLRYKFVFDPVTQKIVPNPQHKKNQKRQHQRTKKLVRGGHACSHFRKEVEELIQKMMPYYRLDMLWGEILRAPQEFLINLFLGSQNRVKFDLIDESLQCMGIPRIIPWDYIFESISEEEYFVKNQKSISCVTCTVKEGSTKLWMVRLTKGWDEGIVFVLEWILKQNKIIPWVYTMKKWNKKDMSRRQAQFINKIVNLINYYLWKLFLKTKV